MAMTVRAPGNPSAPLTQTICDVLRDMDLFFTLDLLIKRGKAFVEEIMKDHKDEIDSSPKPIFYGKIDEASISVHIRDMQACQIIDEDHRDESEAGQPRVFYKATPLGIECYWAWKAHLNTLIAR